MWTLSYDQIARFVDPTVERYSDLSKPKKAEVIWYKGDAAVGAMRLFDALYLRPAYEGDAKVWDSLFYGTNHLPTPSFHEDYIRDLATHTLLAYVMPRGAAKTTILRAMTLMELVTCPGIEIVYGTSSHPLAEKTGDKIKFQLSENHALLDDWTPEYEGPMQPDRGHGQWGTVAFVLRNRASFNISSVGSMQRGFRVDKYRFDDPEWDPDASTDMVIACEALAQLITKVITPMVTKPGASFSWTGTMISQKHLLWMAMENKTVVVDGEAIEVPILESFQDWERKIVDVVREEPGGPVSIWPEMWPLDERDKEARKLPPETKTLVQLERMMTTPAFMAEMRAQPGAGGAAYFGELTEKDHAWWLDDSRLDEAALHHPRISKTPICWWRGDTKVSMPLEEFLRRYPTFLTLDAAYTESPVADFKVVTCMAVTDMNELFVLDTWGDNMKPMSVQVQKSFQMAEKWGCVAMCPEEVAGGKVLLNSLNEIVRTRASDLAGASYFCPVRGLKVGTTEKTAKISVLLLRFQHGKIKLPLYLRGRFPFAFLFNQIRDFNPNVADGGLKKDDFIDSVCMSQYVTKLPRVPGEIVEPVNTALARLRRGERTDEFGFPIIYQLPGKGMTKEDVLCLNKPPEPKSKGPRGRFL